MSEIDKAAERRLKNESPHYIHSGQSMEDADLLADWAAPLLDETQIDEAWLRSVGFRHCDGGWYIVIASGPNRLYWVGGLVSASRGGHTHVSLRTGLKTRGDLRLLCRALAIPLNESREP